MTKSDPLAPSPSEAVAEVVVRAVSIVIDALVLRLTFEALHAEHPVVPTFGFWQCLLVVWVILSVTRQIGKMVSQVSREGKVGAPEDSR